MINDNDFFIVMKLTSGENVMAVLRQEDDEHILVEHPMVMRSIMNFEEGKEHLTAAPLCSFTDDIDFVIPKSNVMFIKKLHHVFIPHYKRIVSEHEESTTFVPNGESSALNWDDSEEQITPERARKMIDQLKNVVGIEEEEIDWKEKLRMLVPGNDTIN